MPDSDVAPYVEAHREAPAAYLWDELAETLRG